MFERTVCVVTCFPSSPRGGLLYSLSSCFFRTLFCSLFGEKFRHLFSWVDGPFVLSSISLGYLVLVRWVYREFDGRIAGEKLLPHGFSLGGSLSCSMFECARFVVICFPSSLFSNRFLFCRLAFPTISVVLFFSFDNVGPFSLSSISLGYLVLVQWVYREFDGRIAGEILLPHGFSLGGSLSHSMFECAQFVVIRFPSSLFSNRFLFCRLAFPTISVVLFFSLDNLGLLSLLLVGGSLSAVTWRSALSMFERALFVVMLLNSRLSCPFFFFVCRTAFPIPLSCPVVRSLSLRNFVHFPAIAGRGFALPSLFHIAEIRYGGRKRRCGAWPNQEGA